MYYFIAHFVSDVWIRQPRTGMNLIMEDVTYSFSTKYGRFSVPYITVKGSNGFELTLCVNQNHYSKMARAILDDFESTK
jgi:hypothetical protein